MIKDKIITIVATQVGKDRSEITEATSMTDDLGADSLDAVEIIMAIEEEFQIEIADEDAMTFNNVGDLIQYVESKK